MNKVQHVKGMLYQLDKQTLIGGIFNDAYYVVHKMDGHDDWYESDGGMIFCLDDEGIVRCMLDGRRILEANFL